MERADLWAAFKERGCQRARETLILAHLGYVPMTLQRVLPQMPPGIDRDDLIAEGRLAVVRAVDRFDPMRAVKFTSFLIATVRGALLEHLRRESWAPRSAYRRQRETGEPVLVLVPLDETYRLPGSDNRDDARFEPRRDSAADRLMSPEPEPLAVALQAGHRAAVRQAVLRLPDPERAVITLCYYREIYQEEIAARVGCSPRRVNYLKKEALKALRRSALAAWEEPPARSPGPPRAAVAPPRPAPEPPPSLTALEAQVWELYYRRNMTRPQVQAALGIGEYSLKRLLRSVREKQAEAGTGPPP